MEPQQNEGNTSQPSVVRDLKFFQVLEDGQIRFKWPPHLKSTVLPCPADDSDSPVLSKDVTISTSQPVSARIFLPRLSDPNSRLPLLFYIHGGAFQMQSPFSPQYHNYVANLVAEAKVIAVSVDYGLFPARPIPACYEDSWVALNWVASHSTGEGGPEPWLNRHADFDRVFIGGDSAGGNITHTLVVRVSTVGLPGRVRVVGAILIHPYFGGVEEDDEMWMYMCPENEGPNDRRMKPPEEDLARLGCERVLVFVAEKDHLMPSGKAYYERLMGSGWGGTAEIVENKGKEHCFHLFESGDEEAASNQKRIVSFIHS